MPRHCYDDHFLITVSFLFPEVHVEPHKKQLHVTLAYHFQASHLPTLEKLAQNIDVKLGCDWVATIFSRDIRFANHEVMSPCGS